MVYHHYIIPILKRFYLFLNGREGRKRERNIVQLPVICALTRYQAQNLGMCPDQGSNQQHFALQDDSRPTEPHRSRQSFPIYNGRN